MNTRDSIEDIYQDVPLLFMDPKDYDDAIIGVLESKTHEMAVAYDYDKVIKINMDITPGSTYEEAVEFFNYNQLDAYVGKHTPVFIHKLRK